MIKALVFDFGDVFINLDKRGTIKRAQKLFGFDIISEKRTKQNAAIFHVNDQYEKGEITTESFIDFYVNLAPNLTKADMVTLWNSLIKDFPDYRLNFIKQLKHDDKFHLILLSNTNSLHINYIKEHVSFYDEFKACFDKFYLSHEIHLRKPNAEIFEFVLKENQLEAQECLFIDDTKENTNTARALGFHVWNIDEHSEDVITLFETHKHLFN